MKIVSRPLPNVAQRPARDLFVERGCETRARYPCAHSASSRLCRAWGSADLSRSLTRRETERTAPRPPSRRASAGSIERRRDRDALTVFGGPLSLARAAEARGSLYRSRPCSRRGGASAVSAVTCSPPFRSRPCQPHWVAYQPSVCSPTINRHRCSSSERVRLATRNQRSFFRRCAARVDHVRYGRFREYRRSGAAQADTTLRRAAESWTPRIPWHPLADRRRPASTRPALVRWVHTRGHPLDPRQVIMIPARWQGLA
jgi:hypothetical protein